MSILPNHATLNTGGWLNLARQGLSPCKKHQASLGALTWSSPAPEANEDLAKATFYTGNGKSEKRAGFWCQV